MVTRDEKQVGLIVLAVMLLTGLITACLISTEKRIDVLNADLQQLKAAVEGYHSE